MKIKGLAITLIAVLLSSNASAGFCNLFCQGKFYLGPTLLLQQVSANQSNFRGLHPRASFGYADWSNKYYMAAELFAIPATLTLSDRRNQGGSSAKISRNWGASLIPGTLLSSTVWGYLRLGFISSYFSSPGSSKMGIQGGVGLQGALTQQWMLRGEYIYTGYNHVSQVGTPNSNEIGIGFIYYFDNKH